MTKELQDMGEAERMISLLNIENKKEILENLNETIKAYKNDMPDADRKLNFLFEQLQFNQLDEDSKNEIYNSFLLAIKSAAGYKFKSDYLWNTGTQLAPLKPSLKETIATGDSIQGPDSNRFTHTQKRTQSADGLFRNKPEKKKQDKDELDIKDKLEKLKKLFLSRNQKDVSIDDIRKILTTESEEQIISAKQFLKEASEKAKTISKDYVMEYYFSEDSPITSTFSSSAWAAFKYVHLDKDNRVTASNSFFVKVGQKLSKERIIELQNVGIKIYFNESLTEAFSANDDILDGITYEELVSIVLTYHDDPDESAIMREYDKLLSKKMKNAKFEMRKAAKQLLKDLQNESTIFENKQEDTKKAKEVVKHFIKQTKGNEMKVHKLIKDNIVNNPYVHNSNSFVMAVWNEFKKAFPS